MLRVFSDRTSARHLKRFRARNQGNETLPQFASFFRCHDIIQVASSEQHDTFHLMAIAALDIGSKRIGIAVSDSEGRFIHPVATIERCSSHSDLKTIAGLLASREVDRVIIGLPLNMDGSESRMARVARSFAARVEEATGLSVEFQDERLSTFEARDRLATLGGRRGRKKRAVDALAAVIILESWFETRKRGQQSG